MVKASHYRGIDFDMGAIGRAVWHVPTGGPCLGAPEARPHHLRLGGRHHRTYPMRAFVREHGLVHLEVAFCKGCHEVFSEQILANYKTMERFDEGARFLEEFGWAEEVR